MAWQSRPVFISSTFADMQAERDHLRSHVFPALEEHLRARHRHLEWVDLRLGVATASLEDGQQREMQVLKVCLAEVRRCRPFLIVLLGDRYGWVPPAERIEAAAREEGLSGDIAGRSVTDLEIRFGILDDPEQQPRSFFYFREPLPYAAMPPALAALYSDDHGGDPGAADRSRRLAGLKQDIEARMPDRVRRYAVGWDGERHGVNGLDEWGRSVVDDILSELDKDATLAGAEAEVSWQQAERNALDEYIEDRARDFVGRTPILSRLEGLATAPAQSGAAWGLCLTGEAGSGKSAIFGEMHRRLNAHNTIVLAHAAGASPRATSVDDMLRRWIKEMGAALGTDSGLADNADPDTIDTTFHALLGRVAEQHRVVVLVDALDQFEATTRARFMTWLPRVWPANARLIATAIPGDASKALGQRVGAETMPLPSLDAEEACRITEAICGRYHRTLEPAVIEALLAKVREDEPAWSNPLWLVLAVEELNLVDADDFARATRTFYGAPAEQLRALMLDIVAELPTDVLSLYRATIERAEKLFGNYLARTFLGFIAVTRAGWRESDFRSLLPRLGGEPWDELRFVALRRLFRGQIRQRGTVAQWDFNHAQMRAAVRQYMAAQSVAEAEFHTEVVEHLLALPADDPLRQSETMVHLLGAEDWLCAATFYGAMSLTQPELAGATRVLADMMLTQAGGVDRVLMLFGTTADDGIDRSVAERLIFELDNKILADRAQLSDRAALLEGAQRTFDRLAKADPGNAGWQRDLSVAHIKIGDVLRAQGNLPAALESFRTSLAIRELLAKSAPGDAGFQSDIAVARTNIGDVLVAQGNLQAALAWFQAALAIADCAAKTDPGNAGWQRELAMSHIKIGDVHSAKGNLEEALAAFQASYNIVDRLAKADPGNAGSQRDLSVVHNFIGNVLVDHGNLPAALESYTTYFAIIDRLAKADPGNAGWQHDLSVAHIKIGNVLEDQDNLAAALAAFQASYTIFDRLAKVDPGNAGWQRNLSMSHIKIGDVHSGQGNLEEARAAFYASHAIADRLAKADPENAGWQRDLSLSYNRIGDVLRDQGHLPAALENFRASLAIRERLVKMDPDNAGWQLDLSLSHNYIGDVLREQGNLPAALESFRASLAIRERLVKMDPGNAGWQSHLSVSHNNIDDVLRE